MPAWIHAQRSLMAGLEQLADRLGRRSSGPPHLAVGLKGEREAFFELRRLGYTVVARRWTSPKLRGDVDLIAWHRDQLCFVEVKTRSERYSMAPAETAVDHDKQRMLRRMASAYLKSFPEARREEIAVRFDILSVYLSGTRPQFELFQDAFR